MILTNSEHELIFINLDRVIGMQCLNANEDIVHLYINNDLHYAIKQEDYQELLGELHKR